MADRTDTDTELASPPEEGKRRRSLLNHGQVYRAGVAMQAFYRTDQDGHCVPLTALDDEQVLAQLVEMLGFTMNINNLANLREQIFGPLRPVEEDSTEARVARLTEQVASLARELRTLRGELVKERDYRLALIEAIQRVQPDIRERLSERFRVTSR